MENDPLLQANSRRYALAFSSSYRDAVTVLLERLEPEAAGAIEHLPLSGQLDVDFSVSALSYENGVWIIFSAPTSPRYFRTHAGHAIFDWDRLNYEELKRRVLSEILGFPPGLSVYHVGHYPNKDWVYESRAEVLDHHGMVHGKDQARLDLPRGTWESATAQVKRAMDAPGTAASGRQFEKGLRRVLELAGCSPRDVRNTGEQVDASCWILNIPVLFEMINSNTPAGAPELAELLSKLTRRPANTVGVLCSPSGFTEGAELEPMRRSGERAILLWGREDIEGFLQSQEGAKDFFQSHYREFVDRAGASP